MGSTGTRDNPHQLWARIAAMRWRTIAEVVGLIGVIATLVFNALALASTADSIDASRRQLAESQYESVYQHQLALWQLAVENRHVAPYIVGGELPPAGRPDIDAAVINALDFYAYVFEQLAPRGRGDQGRLDDILSEDPEKQLYEKGADWDAWRSWAATIVSGFVGAPGMCRQLAEGQSAYDPDFYSAVKREVAGQVPACSAL